MRKTSNILKGFLKNEALKPIIIMAFLIILGALISIFTSQFGVKGAGLFFVAIVGIPSVYFIVVYPKFGITVLFILAYFIMWFIRLNMVDYPLGTVMDFLQALLILGFFIKQKSNPDWSIFKDPLGGMILIWVLYNVLQIVNPTAESRMAWLYTIRSVAGVMLLYFVFTYQIREIKFVRLILKIWIFLTVIAALYAYKQELFGFFYFEEIEIQTPRLRKLLFINGVWRKFSIFSDPVAFSYNMVSCSLFCIALLFGPLPGWKKVVLGCLVLFFLSAMLLSGTRGAYVLIPVGIVMLTILNFNKKVLIFSIFSGILLLFLVYVPTSSPSIKRFQSAFTPSDDASFNLRAMNQKKIQPYIQKHPFGGGLGATGVWGARFSPHSFLAGFPPDSGYVRVAVELGWVGLFLFCTLMFVILKTGIKNYFEIKDPELKNYCLATVVVIFAYGVGNYPQESFVQFPSNIYFYFFIALISITLKIDKMKSQTQLQSNKK
ncbi:putative inorganic carbon (HCO3(-)) transporter [Pedobacter sp. CG_S7]|uniref:O-antigen ligase family protein n=1 Tax=Pedobacter sp. CG_S7 TaxID=3143930 RepID=UPI0033943B10